MYVQDNVAGCLELNNILGNARIVGYEAGNNHHKTKVFIGVSSLEYKVVYKAWKCD